MTFIEENGGKLAVALCLASAFPVVGTVYAMETDALTGNSDNVAVVSKSATKVLNTDYIEEDDTDSTLELTGSAQNIVQNTVVKEIKKTVSEQHVPAVEKNVETINETESVTEQVQEQPVVDVFEEVIDSNTKTAIDNMQQEITTENIENAPILDNNNTNVSDTNYQEAIVPEATVQENVNTGTTDTAEAAVDETVDTTVVENQGNQETESNVSDTTNTEETVAENASSNQYASLNASIAAAAQQLVGVTNGQWCTQIAQQALAGAGVSDAMQLWPDEYASTYGYYTDDPQPGNLIYYNNGGRGVDHIAVYIGNGLAVHGNYDGRTEIHEAEGPGSGCVGQAQYIQVCR